MGSNSALERKQGNQIRLGTVAELDLGAGRCRVDTGEIKTDFLPWLVPRAGKAIEWSAPAIGEQVLLLSPEGDMHGAVVLRGIYSDAFPPPSSSESAHLVTFPDGAIIQYDDASHALTAILPAGGSAVITADAGVTINGPLTVNGDTEINGDAQISGTATAEVDVVGGGKSLKTHPHTGVVQGSGVSGPPQ